MGLAIGNKQNNVTVINNYYGGAPPMGQMGPMGPMGPMQMMMQMMKMMMQMMQMMMGGQSCPCMPGQFPGMMPGMMPGIGGMPGMMPGMGGMPPMPPGMAGMLGGMLGGMMAGAMGGGFTPPMQHCPFPGAGAMGIGGPRPLHGGMGGLQLQGNSVTTPGGYKITYQGTDVNIEGMGKPGGGGAGAFAGAFAYSGPGGSVSGAFAFAGAGGMGGPNPTGNTKIWGDPHVNEGDGQRWDWKDKTMSFNLPDGTKLTMNADGPKGVVKSIDIYNGNDHIHGEGGKFQGGNRGDGFMADAMQADGDSVWAGPDGNVSNWYKNPYGMGPEVSQMYKG